MGCEGMARADFRAIPSLSLLERYEDNVRFSSGQKQGDFSTAVGPKLEFSGRIEEIGVSGSLGSRWTQYQKNSNLSRASSLGGISLELDALTGRALRTWGLTVKDNYVYTQEFPEFAQFGNQNDPSSEGVQAGRFYTLGNNFGAFTSYGLSERSQLIGAYSNSMTHFSRGSTLTDTTRNTLTGGLSYTISPLTSLSGNYSYSKFSFGVGKPVEIHVGSVGFQRRFLADLNVDANAGATYLPSSDRLTPTFGLGATQQFSATIVGIHVARSVSSSGGLAAAVSTREILSAHVSHQFSPSLTASFSANYAMIKTLGLRTVDITSYNFSPSISYALNRWANLTASAAHFSQQSKGVVGTSLIKNLVTIGLTLTWP